MNIIYDIETYPNVFTLAAEHADSDVQFVFEISNRKNEAKELIHFLYFIRNNDGSMIGFNNLGFDYPVVHLLLTTPIEKVTANFLYQKAKAIIECDDKFTHMIWNNQRLVKQLDLFKIHHFDNKSRSTDLKTLEFNFCSDNIGSLPFTPGCELNDSDIDQLIHYNQHDVHETKKLYDRSRSMIKFREQLSEKYNKDWMNHNDTKIGKDYFIMELEKQGVKCYQSTTGKRIPRQTIRKTIDLKDAILPIISFNNSEFKRVIEWLKSQTITETKNVFKELTATINGFTFVFGLGGIHGSVDSEIINTSETHEILDVDVNSYYPNLAIANSFYPQHLGIKFCHIFKELYNQRLRFEKGTAENAMLKLALNGVYGDSNNPYSVFYDPLFTMRITLNGQLLLCMLAEKLLTIDGLRLIQINTDGLTIYYPIHSRDEVTNAISQWETFTKLETHSELYKKMFIRDVNNYIAESVKGSIKCKGVYDSNPQLYQNHSSLVIPKSSQSVLLENNSIIDTVINHHDKYDFLIRCKIPRSSKLVFEQDGKVTTLPNVTRFVVSKTGGALFKIMPPLKNKIENRKISVISGRYVTPCNDIRDLEGVEIDYSYYIDEVEKLTLGLA